MKYGRFRLMSALVLAMMLALVGTPAYAQGTVTSTLTGTVMDASGGVIPGADVTVKNNATAAVSNAVTSDRGVFTIPALQPGTYTVTIALMGFKTWSAPDVTLSAAVPAVIKATLEVGKLEETVIVEGAAQLVQTQTSAVATTLNVKQIANLPISRAAFDVVMLTPGVATSDGSLRDSTVNGLPQSVTNITLDGMNIQDNYAKTWDGMFTRVSPRIDAVEEVTVGTAAQGADMAGQGAVQIKFVTRSGTNQYKGSAYYYFRREWMNTNTWWNLHYNVNATTGAPTPKARVATYQPGGRLGGPIWKDKAFFFVNYEDVRSPGTVTSTRTIMSELSRQGLFQYGTGKSVDLMKLAAANNQVSTPDPLIGKLLADIRASTSQGIVNTSATDPLVDTLTWQQPSKGVTHYPTIRLDFNVTAKHRVTASLTQNHLLSDPDTTNSQQRVFPGFPVHGLQDSYRWTSQLSLRSTLTPNMVNEVRLGGTGGATLFSPDLDPKMYSAAVGNMNGYSIAISAFKSISNPSPSSTNSAREGSTRVVEDTLSYIRGSHSISTGFAFTQANVWLRNGTLAPAITLGIASGDTADSMFNTTNFPGASSTELGYARNLYAVLTGRVTNITYTARIGEDGTQYVVNGTSMAKGRLPDIGFFVQDSWRWKPNFTINAGLRYALQKPFYALNNSYSTATLNDLFGKSGVGTGFVPGSAVTGLGNLFKPGAADGSATTYQLLSANSNAYNVDSNNFAPSIGVAWKIGADSGWRNKLLSNDAVLRAGYSVAYQRGGMSDFTEVFGANPGLSVTSPTRSQTNNNLGTLPVLLRSSDLGPGAFNTTRSYPMTVPSASSNVYVFDPNIQVPYAASFSVGIQRAITRSMAGEVRFVHTGSHGTWTLQNVAGAYNYNEVNIVENGFLNEFKLAQANLIASKGKTFAYTGAGTNQLPILLAWLSGKPASQAGTASAYSGSAWTQSSYLAYLYRTNPNPNSLASSINSNATYRVNAAAAGLPANFFVVNPEVSAARMATNGPDTRYNGIQMILTRRFSQGLQLGANYSWGRGYQYAFYGFHKPFVETLQNYSNLSAGGGSVDHNFSANWVYELPFGQGKRFGGGVGRNLNRIIGNWSYQGTGRIQSGRLIDVGNVRMIGFTKNDLQKMLQLRFTTDPTNQFRTLIFDLPQDIIDNTIKAYNYDWAGYTKGTPTGRYFAPANGPDCIESTPGFGDCGARSIIVTGPKVIRFDMSLSKDILITSRIGFRFDVQIFNVFKRVNYTPNVYTGSTADSYRVTGSTDSSRTGQLAFRINW